MPITSQTVLVLLNQLFFLSFSKAYGFVVPQQVKYQTRTIESQNAVRLHATKRDEKWGNIIERRSMLSRVLSVSGAVVTAGSLTAFPNSANARIGKDSEWPLWIALPVAPYSKRKTIRRNIGPGVWTFDQLIGIYYVHVPIRMTVIATNQNTRDAGLLVYAPVAPTKECLSLLQELIDKYGPIKTIILPSVAVEHKVNAGPFARAFPRADFYATDRQYSFPLNLPSLFLGLPPWTKPLPASSRIDGKSIWGENSEFEHEVLTVKPGPGSQFQDVALFHKPSKTLLICDTVFATGIDPPVILTEEPDYTRALLFHARDEKDEVVPDTLENRRKGWRRIVLLFNFFFPGSGVGNLGPGPILQALGTPTNKYGGWMETFFMERIGNQRF